RRVPQRADRFRLPGSLPPAAVHGARERSRSHARCAETAGEGGRGARARAHRAGRPRRSRRPSARRAVGRRAPASGDRPRAHPRSAAAAVRRADGQSRSRVRGTRRRHAARASSHETDDSHRRHAQRGAGREAAAAVRAARRRAAPAARGQRTGNCLRVEAVTLRRLVVRALAYYWRSHLAVVAGVATAGAVPPGAPLRGDSVRGSLRDLVLQRLGHTDGVVTSTGFFRETLAAEMSRGVETSYEAAGPLIILQGIVTDPSSGRRVSHAAVYGVDDRFW